MANIDKFKRYKALRHSEITRIKDLLAVAERALEDKSIHSQFKQRFKQIDSIYDNFDKQQVSIIQLVPLVEDIDVESEEHVRSEFENYYYNIQAIHSDLFDNILENKHNESAAFNSNRIKLPEIKLSKFNGDIKNFTSFIDIFNALVHNNECLSDIEKFSHLHACLEGPPKSLIQRTPMTSDNYVTAYNILVKRYSNSRLLATAHWNEIDEAPRSTCQGLRKLLDIFSENLAALENLNYPVAHWDFILVNMLFKRLDSETISRFELTYGSNEMPTYKCLTDFLYKQCTAFDTISYASPRVKGKTIPSASNRKETFNQSHRNTSSFLASTNNRLCPLCKVDHLLYKCSLFNSKTPHERFNLVKQNKWCINCLSTSHMLKNCNSSSTCRHCHLRHHSMLHFNTDRFANSNFNFSNNVAQNSDENASRPEPGPSTSLLATSNNFKTNNVNSNSLQNNNVLLATVQLEILDSRGNYQKIRALLDGGSQANFITKKFANKLGLSRFMLTLSVHGLGDMNSSSTSGGVNCTIKPLESLSPIYNFEAVILDKICSNLPSMFVNCQNWSYITKLKLADPTFNSPAPVDLLLGADIFSKILENGRIVGDNHMPTALNTQFGWILMGNVDNNNHCNSLSNVNTFLSTFHDYSLDNTIKKFWELEEIPENKFISPEDKQCETIFSDTHFRNESGRYVVSLPFKTAEPYFMDSKLIALRRFNSLERKLNLNPDLRAKYSEFMLDYLNSGHMELISNSTLTDHVYYIPHHAVFKPDSTTTKLRVVFDASAKAANNISLNDCLLVGPKLQQDIVTVLLNFRLHAIVFTADVKQMYRQILINPAHKDFQRILWRFSPSEPLKEYRLNTVTYGVASAPYLAIRTLIQLANDEKTEFPEASKVLLSDIYVDDVVTGCNSLDDAVVLQNQLINLLKRGGFELRKWTSNNPDFLKHLPENHLHTQSYQLDFESDNIKVLGLKWNPTLDIFSYTINIRNTVCTKRNLLSELARIFDPLGFLTPLTFFAKLLIQHLWGLGLDWDELPPPDILNRWEIYKSELSQLSALQIPRPVVFNKYNQCELHGFCDSSLKGYCATVYLRICENNTFSVNLVSAKSKIAPLKRISIPRLELCGALLLSKLLAFILNIYREKIHINNIFAWTDSTVVLHWIKSSPHKWKTFVSNRVALIQENVSPSNWHHVQSHDNPADCGSRGLLPSELLNHSTWWVGPPWLKLPNHEWPSTNIKSFSDTEIHSEERKITLTALISFDSLDILLEKFSSLEKIKRIVAYLLRFIYNLKYPRKKLNGQLCFNELNNALITLIKHTQFLFFEDDIEKINKKQLASKSLRKLNPFLDENSVLRVGGRLHNSSLSFNKKHPILLPRCRFTDLLIEDAHKYFLHPGAQTLQHILSQNFWILSPRRAIRKIVSNCHKCWRLNPKPLQPPMGNLPASRLSQVKAFSNTGIDFGGPYSVTLSKTRGAKTHKAYICLFVCFATKALHLELASDLSTECFLAALRRFIARRGRCSHIFSDCGTNFVGANKYLVNIMKDVSATEKINWHFNPPSAPHFGGIWEAGIKSVKTHIARVIGSQILTYEELYTLLTQIEALLNSRPLCPLSSDPNDLSALTPGHFLTIEPLSVLPDEEFKNVPLNRLNRWQLLQRLHSAFWTRWSQEYLHTLHQRSKWTNSDKPIAPGALVLLKNDNLPPLHWQLGRIIEFHPGTDGVARVATVRTQHGILKRPLVKLCPLPSDQ